MNYRAYARTIVIAVAVGLLPASSASADHAPVVHFDLPPLAAAGPAESDPSDPTLVTVQLRLSAMIAAADVPRIDQWLVRCQPRDSEVSIADYAPRTETSSDLATPIQVKETEEHCKTLGLSLDAAYGSTAHGNAGADHTKKNINTLQFDRIAPNKRSPHRVRSTADAVCTSNCVGPLNRFSKAKRRSR